MSNWDSIAVRDFGGTSRSLRSHIDANSGHHPTTVPVAAMFLEASSVGLTTSNTDIAIDPQATWLMIDLGTANPAGSASTLRIGAQYTASGDFYTAPVYFGAPIEWQATSKYATNYVGTTSYPWNEIRIETVGDNDNEGGRILWLPVFGVKTIRLALNTGTWSGIAWRQFAGQSPFQITMPIPRLVTSAYPDTFFTTTTYADGDVLGDVMRGLEQNNLTMMRTNAGGQRIRTISFADYAGLIDDFDLYVMNPGSESSPLGDNTAYDPVYPEGIREVLEFRLTPTAGQYKIRTYGASAGRGGTVPGLDILLDYVDDDTATGYVDLFNFVMVNRVASKTFASAETVYFEVGVEL